MNQVRSSGCEAPSQPKKNCERLRLALKKCVGDVAVTTDEIDMLADRVGKSIQKRNVVEKRWSPDRLDQNDIAFLIQSARDNGDINEAYWRAFLAAHFGRCSTRDQKLADSAGRLICGFESKPFWTWRKVCKDKDAFRQWLNGRRADLATVVFGNHRKFESKRPERLWRVIESFLELVAQYGGSPLNLLTSTGKDPKERFAELFDRLYHMQRFGRTARFDFLTFMADLNLVEVEPDACHLKGSTGPLAGARKLWGHLPVKELDIRANALASKLGVSPHVVEDALCNWQK